MKTLLRTVLFLALALVLATPALALDWDGLSDSLGLEELERKLPESAASVPLSPETDYGALVEKTLREALSDAGFLKGGLRGALLILLAAVLVSVFSALHTEGTGTDPAQLAGVLAVGAVAAGDLRLCFGLGQKLLTELETLSHALLPCLTGAMAFSGAAGAATAKYAASALAMDVALTAARTLLLPLIGAYLAAALASAALPGEGLASAVSFLKWLCGFVLTLLGLGMVLFINLSGLAAGAVDAAALRTLRTGLSTSLPVVGGILSDAGASILAAANAVKATVGAFGLAALLTACLAPFLRLGTQYLIYKASAALAGSLAGGRVGKAAAGASSAFALLLGTEGLCALALFFSVYSFMRAVT